MLSVSGSLSSALWRSTEDQDRHQEEINEHLSQHYLRALRVMSYVLFYSFFCGFVIVLFNSLHPSDQLSVQSLNAQPSVTAAISKISARLALDSPESLLSSAFASFSQIASVIMSNGKRAQGSSGCLSCINDLNNSSRSRRCVHGVSRSHHGRQQSALLCTELALAGVAISAQRD